MNPVFKVINNIVIAINRLIDSMPMKTVQTVQRAFFFVVFLMCIAGVFIGYNMGTKSARIKSPPLAENVNDTFRIDINRERDMGSFAGTLESEMIEESDTINSNKVDFFVRERLETETDNSVIDSGKNISDPVLDEKIYKPESTIDDDSRYSGERDSTIKLIDRTIKTDTRDDIIIRNKQEEKEQTGTSGTDKKTDIRMLERDKTIIPETMQKDQGTPLQ